MAINHGIRKVIPELLKATGQDKEWFEIAIKLGMNLAEEGIGPCDTLEVAIPKIVRASNNKREYEQYVFIVQEASKAWHKRFDGISWSWDSERSYHAAYQQFLMEIVLPILRNNSFKKRKDNREYYC